MATYFSSYATWTENGSLQKAINANDLWWLERLLRDPGLRATINNHDAIHSTPARCAIRNNNPIILARLMAVPSFDVNTWEPGIGTALSFACLYNRPACVAQLLKSAVIDINLPDPFGWTPLHQALTPPEPCCFNLLLNQPTLNINAVTKNGETALYLATKFQCTDSVACILAHSGLQFVHQRHLKTNMSALELAHHLHLPACIALLQPAAFWHPQARFIVFPLCLQQQVALAWQLAFQRTTLWQLLPLELIDCVLQHVATSLACWG